MKINGDSSGLLALEQQEIKASRECALISTQFCINLLLQNPF